MESGSSTLFPPSKVYRNKQQQQKKSKTQKTTRNFLTGSPPFQSKSFLSGFVLPYFSRIFHEKSDKYALSSNYTHRLQQLRYLQTCRSEKNEAGIRKLFRFLAATIPDFEIYGTNSDQTGIRKPTVEEKQI